MGKIRQRFVLPRVERLEDRQAPSASPLLAQSFDTTPVLQLPAGWTQWTSTGLTAFAVSNSKSLSPTHSIAATTGVDGIAARTWPLGAEPADVEVNASVFLGS